MAFVLSGAPARAEPGVGNGFLAGAHVFFYSDDSKAGGDALRSGDAAYTRFDAQYNMAQYYVGGGAFYEQDKFGGSEKDKLAGFVLEASAGHVFLKVMPGFVEQQFSGHSFLKRTGKVLAAEAGIRADFYAGLIYYELTLHRRTTEITQEDGRAVSGKLSKTETMPMFGMGVSL